MSCATSANVLTVCRALWPSPLLYSILAGFIAKKLATWACIIVIIGFIAQQYYAMKAGVGMTGGQKSAMKQSFMSIADVDGDGKVGVSDAMAAIDAVKPKVIRLIEYILPSGTSFIGGFCAAL